ncbi:uncharacterized protein LACBIDRAFT_298887 [Laccaria bicolor S238N-H82]|uniref:Predicted protein n=1 Tax=Laccaria bicolor (strain S238N-H82 / ATCC MYA-4686) TaxID=486041 RepID=B0DE83_LACBS|nr:uncharacterized protein LACBIDRAFT_298887 [Laccaria bicolor S238N-H82]EDR07220.1 predicted protein [Laccaria bicolor S238N-H82]|eukprot:XP_001882151.1 predicted protein [Laccaria bicolor S238N-H82]
MPSAQNRSETVGQKEGIPKNFTIAHPNTVLETRKIASPFPLSSTKITSIGIRDRAAGNGYYGRFTPSILARSCFTSWRV